MVNEIEYVRQSAYLPTLVSRTNLEQHTFLMLLITLTLGFRKVFQRNNYSS